MAIATANRNSAETDVPIRPPTLLNEANRVCRAGRGHREGERQADHDGGVAEGEEQAHAERPFAVLHEFASDVVDRGNVVGVEGVPQAEAVGEDGGSQQDGIIAKGQDRPKPDQQR